VSATAPGPMRIDVWSDVVCPWCYIGKRRLEKALSLFDNRRSVAVHWRAFELDPHAPPERTIDPAERLAAKYGMTVEQARRGQERLGRLAAEEGLAYRLDAARSGNTFDAHRLIHLAAGNGTADAAEERFMSAYLCEGEAIGRPEVLARLAAEIGLDPGRVSEVLAGDELADAVRADEAEAAARGITAVPTFVVDGRFTIPGAQDPETILTIVQRAWTRREAA
jgi:predicted DsbA family dithiol-disulfide isomerase